MGTNLAERMARIHELELLRQEALHKTESITRDEEARLLQLRLLMMRDENADLRDRIGERDYKISAMMRDGHQARLDLEECRRTISGQGARLKKQDMEMASLKAEMEALNVSVNDSAKLLQEKFALTRELEHLRPELEHLQSQLTTHQATVAEKNDLRRQLDSLEAELENERRSRQRLQSRNDDAATAELAARLEDAEKRLAAEQKEGGRMKKELERQVASAKAENERLEERVSGLREKTKGLQAELREAREHLDEAQAQVQSELAAAQSRPESRGAEDKPRKATAPAADAGGRKRRAPAMSLEEVTIQTPGNDMTARERPTKKRGTDKVKAAVGEKSVFSVTPFLTRSKSLTGDSATADQSSKAAAAAAAALAESCDESPDAEPPASDAGPAAPEPLSDSEAEAPKPKVSFRPDVSFQPPAKAAARPTRAVRQAKPMTPLGDATPAKANRVVKARGTPKVRSIPEAPVDNKKTKPSHDPESSPDQDKVVSSVAASKKAAAAAEVKRRKRKLLGAANTTLLDDSDGDGDGGGGGGEALAESKPQLAAVAKRTRARLGGGVRNAFAGGSSSFSPLKRDRRGTSASFLA
ncbi:hypothetical protein E4U41_007663 [Claviceps citrina]|nr:hypothetical protein E4U41_007663 [Claviceps citrina]